MDTGGGESVFNSLITGIDKKKYSPVLACFKQKGVLGENLQQEGYPVYSDLLSYQADIRILARLCCIIRKEGIGIVYMMDYRDVMFWGILAAKMSGVKAVMATHSTSWWGKVSSITLIGKRFLPWCDKIITICDFQKEHLIKHENISAGMIEVVHNGIDSNSFLKHPHRRVNKKDLNIPENSLVVGTVAVLRKEKNLQLFLESAALLLGGRKDVYFVIAGDGSEKEALLRCCREKGIHDHVIFTGRRDDIALLLQLFDIFVLTSVFEVMPLSILEAMAAGVPVVSTPVGAVAEMIANGKSGYVLENFSAHALAERINFLLGNAELRKRMGTNSQKRVNELFSLQKMIHSTERIFDSLV